MDNVVTQEVLKRIDAIAEKMGTTAQYLWPKLVAYQHGKALGFALGYAIITALSIGVFYGVATQWDKISKADAEGPAMSSLVVLGIMVIAGFFVLTLWAVPVLMSPEAAAFYKMIAR